ncbi:Sulfur carrier protein adenylyltransferase ThiF [Minicystis rosea]|nr:Sulfur carrier protein adenylyltransferase ThiF [Minicystis rosea]
MHLRIPQQLWEPLHRELFARLDVETAGIILAEPYTLAEGARLLVARTAAVVPESAYVIRAFDQLRLDPVALNRLVRPAREYGWAIITVHTHPGATEPWFSWADDRGDARLMPSFATQVPSAPHGSMVVVADGLPLARIFDGGPPREIGMRIVGERLVFWPPARAPAADPAFNRQTLALGATGQAALRAVRVGVVGLGGTGSVTAAQLAHLGVGGLVLVDGDRVEASNVPRVFGATKADIGALKVDVAARYARALDVSAVSVPTALAGDEQIRMLYGCDVVFSCVDRHTPRALLNRLAYSACIPVIDLGVAFRADERGDIVGDAGRVVVLGPGRPCLACWGVLDPERLRIEALSECDAADEARAGYIDGAHAPQPSVIAFNVMVAGAAVVELLRLVTGFASGAAGPSRLSFSFSAATMRRTSLASSAVCSICGHGPVRG